MLLVHATGARLSAPAAEWLIVRQFLPL